MSSSSTQTPLHHNRWAQLALGMTVSAVCLWFAARGLLDDPQAFQKAQSAFANAKYESLVPIMAATVLFYWLKSLRWRLLLKPVGSFRTIRDLYPFVMIGFGFNNLLPMQLGEVVRVLLFARHARIKVSTAATSVVLERIFDSISVLTMLSIGLLFVPGLSEEIRSRTHLLAGIVVLLVIGMLLYVFFTQQFIRFVDLLLSRILPSSWVLKVNSVLTSSASGLAALKEPKLVAGILTFSISSWVVNGTVIYLALWSFNLPHNLLISCVVLSLTAIGAALPAGPGYVGIIQICFITVLTNFTNDEVGIFAASVYYHLIEYVIVTLLGLYFFNTTGVSLAEIREQVEQNHDMVDQSAHSTGSPAQPS